MHHFTIPALAFAQALEKMATGADLSSLEKSVKRLEKLEEDPPETKQLGRYAMIGAGVAPVTSILGDVIEGSPITRTDAKGRFSAGLTARRLAGKSITGAITSGLVPVLRHQIDRHAEIGELRSQLAKLTAPPVEPPAPPSFSEATANHLKAASALIPGGSSPASRLASSNHIGSPRMTNLAGPSIAQLSRTYGKVQPGAAKGTI